jgi:hypothetical protein
MMVFNIFSIVTMIVVGIRKMLVRKQKNEICIKLNIVKIITFPY